MNKLSLIVDFYNYGKGFFKMKTQQGNPSTCSINLREQQTNH